jgi:hypothetical protein
VLLVSAVALGTRLYRAAAQSIAGDEIYSVQYAQLGLSEIIRTNIANIDPHAPLFYLLLKFWITVAGQSELSFRYLPIFFGVLTIPLLYLLGRWLFNRGVGLLAALILAVNPFHIWYAQETRTYTLTVFLVLLSVLFFLRAWRGPSLGLWISYVVVTTLAVYSHYYSFLIVLFQNIAFLVLYLWRRPRGLVIPWVVVQALLVLPYLPWAGYAAKLMLSYPSWRQPMGTLAMSYNLVQFFSIGWFVESDLATLLVAIFSLVSILGILAHLWPRARSDDEGQLLQPRQRLAFLLLYLLVPFLSVVIYYKVTNRFLFQERYFLIITPAYLLLLAHGLAALKRFFPPAAVAGVLFILGASLFSLNNYYHDPKFSRSDLKAVAQYVEAHEEAQDTIIIAGDGNTAVFRHYYRGKIPIQSFRGFSPLAEVEARLEGLARSYQRIWFLPYADTERDLFVENWLNTKAYKIGNIHFPATRLTLYSLVPGARWQEKHLGFNWENQVQLASYKLSHTVIEPGQVLGLALTWKALRGGLRDLQITVRLLDEEGHVLTLIDRQPQDGFKGTASWQAGEKVLDNYGLLVPPGALPGSYTIDVGLYEADSGRQLAVLDSALRPAGTRRAIAQVQVKRSGTFTSRAPLPAGSKANADFGGKVRLVGYTLPASPLRPGETLPLVLFWKPGGRERGDLTFIGEVLDDQGRLLGRVEGSLANRIYPTSKWQGGEAIRDFMDIPLRGDAKGGRAMVRLRVMDSEGELSVKGQAAALKLGEVEIVARKREFQVPSMQYTVGKRLGDSVELLGYDLQVGRLSGKEGQGRTLRLTLYWRALSPMRQSLKVFAHLLSQEGQLLAQHDGIPARGLAPTSSWLRGEVVRDVHVIPLDERVAPGEYALEVGMYEPVSGKRLTGSNGKDRLLLGWIPLK